MVVHGATCSLGSSNNYTFYSNDLVVVIFSSNKSNQGDCNIVRLVQLNSATHLETSTQQGVTK